MIDFDHNTTEVDKWWEVDGDNTLRLDYPLQPGDVIFDIGGFRGEWTWKLRGRHPHCSYHIFEPVVPYAATIAAKFKDFPNVTVYPTGIGAESFDGQIYFPTRVGDEATLHPDDPSRYISETIHVTDIVEAFDKCEIDFVELMKINIEGHEFDLLERMIKKGLHKNVGNLQIQFHKIDGESEVRRQKIQNKLSKTHECTWNYPWVWENWKLK